MAYSLDVHPRQYNISLWRCDVDAVGTAGVSSLNQLEELSLASGDDMSDNFFQALSKLTNLKSLEF